MTAPNQFSRAMEKRIYEVGSEIERARLALRMSIRTAAERTITQSQRGRMTEATWRRVEKGYTSTNLGKIVYRPTGSTLMAMAEVVGLDGEELCKKLGLEAPPKIVRRNGASEIAEIRSALVQLTERLAQFEQNEQR